MFTELRELVEIESPSDQPGSVNAAAAWVVSHALPLGATVVKHPQTQFGNVIEIQFAHSESTRKPILLLGHLDTVWPLGTLAAMPWREDARRFYGPGVLDMKAGIIMALNAIRSLRNLGAIRPITLLLNSEEEVGSPISRPVTERLAQKSEAVFVLEPAQGLAYKTARKGVAHYELHVAGIAAHAGVDFERGSSAIREIARLVETISGFTDLSIGRTVNCGRIEGGTRANVIAASATAEIDVRVTSAADAELVEHLFSTLEPTDQACRLTVTGRINRPPMERSPGTVALFERARTLAAELGFDLAEASTGGGSDGNFTAALGIPTLDGMGAVGEGAHAAHESVVIDHLIPRTALLAAMLASV
jgi:glutamate carboxypeptidase